MNDPSNQPTNIEEQKAWLRDHRASTGESWAKIAGRMGIPAGTLSQFGGSGYAGDNQGLADKVYRFRQTLMQQASLAIEAPDLPDFFQTETTVQLCNLLSWGQRGRIVVAAMGPGNSKTQSAKHFRSCYSNVFLATMTPSTAGVMNMQKEVLESMGETETVGSPQELSRRIRAKVRDLKNPLIILDEAQHLTQKALEEARSWNDLVGVGLALFGNIGVMNTLEGGSRKSAFAQLFSRVSLKIVRAAPLQADADALAIAWKITGDAEMAYIRKVAMMPGGLRGATMMLELAWMLAASDGKPLALDHLQDAWAQLSTRAIAA